MPKVLRVKDWRDLYENNRSRELRYLDWVPIPNRMDSDDYTFLASRPDGAACLGAWWAIVCIASRCDVRGTLLRSNGEPHNSQSLARMSHLPATVFEQCIPLFLSIPWIEEVDLESTTSTIPQLSATIPQSNAGIPHDPAFLARARRTERKGTERKGTERNQNGTLNTPQDGATSELIVSENGHKNFEILWGLFVAAGKALNDQDRKKAFKEFLKIKPENHPEVLRWVFDQIQTTWTDPRYTPFPHRALETEGWKRIAEPRIIPVRTAKQDAAVQMLEDQLTEQLP